MDQMLSPLTTNETSFTLIDISDDEELLPIDCYKIREEFKSVETHDKCFTQIQQKCDSKSISNISSKVSEEKIDLKAKSVIDCNQRTNRSTCYTECPLCDSCGPKSITHIKQCAQRRSVDPKRLIELLKGCKKTDIPIDGQKRHFFKSNTKHMKKSNKIMNNYVISFDAEKGLKLSVNSCDKKSINNGMNYELSVLDINKRQILLETKISDQIICNVANNFANKEDIDRVLVPNLWKLALLQSQSNDYIVQDFQKYINCS